MALKLHCDLPSGLSCKESACQCRRCRFDPWVRGDPLEKGMATIPVFLPGKFQGGRSLVGYSPWGRTELDTAEHRHKTWKAELSGLDLLCPMHQIFHLALGRARFSLRETYL